MPATPTFSSTVIADTLLEWLSQRLEAPTLQWLKEKGALVARGDRKALYLAFGLVSRKTGKADLALNDAELAQAEQVRPGWNPRRWTVDQAARVWLVLQYPAGESAEFLAMLDPLFAAGEVHELVALYQGLPLYPHQSALALRCAEGQRTHMQAVFEAIAHDNPFPAEQLDDNQWNQLILKSLFIGIPLDRILGLDARANPQLAQMLTDFAAERKAAGRTVSEELWRCVRPFEK